MGAKQTTLFRGIYEFEDPSGTLIAAKVPATGTVDLYSGTAVIVKPSQCAVFVYQGKIADILLAGTHEIKTGNLPLLTKLANWKFGFESPLRCELIFISGHIHMARRWGTQQPILFNTKEYGSVPIRSYGNFSLVVSDPHAFFLKVMGTRGSFSISDLEEMVQGQISELLPEILAKVSTLEQLATSYNDLSVELQKALNKELKEYGVQCQKIQILSALPSKEIIEAIDAKTAIKVLGSQREYMLYKAANSLGNENGSSTANDPMQMMMGLMLGKGLMGNDYHEREEKVAIYAEAKCASCNHKLTQSSKFCSQCGKRS